MKTSNASSVLVVMALVAGFAASAQDWPQWRGMNRDAKASGFTPPKAWPEKLTQKWKVTVGRGDASPAIVGDKIYVFSRQETGETLACLEAGSGKELWRDKYEAQAAVEPMGRHPGPRSSPAVAQGKVVAYGVRGALSCLDAASGKVLWRKTESGGWPRFFTSSSPLIVDGLCIAMVGTDEKGAIVAYDLATGDEKWKWSDDGAAYSSPVILNLEGTRMVVGMTAKRVVGLGVADGKLLWEAPFPVQGRAYNAATPLVNGQMVIVAGSGRGTKALRIEKASDGYAAKELWHNADNAVQFNTPVLLANRVYGLSQKGDLFCISAQDGKTLWSAPLGGKDFGSVVDAGTALLALTTQGDLTVFEPSDKEFKKLASYKVADSDTYAYPILVGKGIFIKDQESLALWALD